jgi:uncharacterized peroxidase-related enzyme
VVRLFQKLTARHKRGEPVTSSAARLLRGPEERRATFLDLFLDLVFVFALFQLSQGLLDHLRWSDAFETLVLLLAVFTMWGWTSWITDWFDPRRPAIQVLVIACMFGSFVLAVAVPAAFGSLGLLFAGAYVAVQVGRTLTLVVVLRGHPRQHLELQVLFWYGVSAVPWIVGAVVDGWARGVLWVLAVAVDYASPRLGWPTPGLGRARTATLAIEGELLAERHRQFFIVALGELILATGLALTSSGVAIDRGPPVVVAFATTVLLWRIYIYRAGEVLGRHRGPGSASPCRLLDLRPPGHGRRHRYDLRRRRPRHRPPVRAHPTGVDRRHPRRTRTLPRRTSHVRVRGVRPGVPKPSDRRPRPRRHLTGNDLPAAGTGRRRSRSRPGRGRRRRRGPGPRTPTRTAVTTWLAESAAHVVKPPGSEFGRPCWHMPFVIINAQCRRLIDQALPVQLKPLLVGCAHNGGMFIETILEDAATGATAEYYRQQRDAWGFLPNYVGAFGHRPDVAQAWNALNLAIRGGMDRRRYELATIAAARALRSTYCTTAHSKFLRDVCGDETSLHRIAQAPAGETLDELDRAVYRFATKVATDAASVEQDDIDELRAAGLSDADIADVVYAAAARSFFTRVLDGLGARLDFQTSQEFEPELYDSMIVGRQAAEK